jgi:hypothetical protein
MPQTLYLIDGHALAYRTYFALTGAGQARVNLQLEPMASSAFCSVTSNKTAPTI